MPEKDAGNKAKWQRKALDFKKYSDYHCERAFGAPPLENTGERLTDQSNT
jgi:hypothetical protein